MDTLANSPGDRSTVKAADREETGKAVAAIDADFSIFRETGPDYPELLEQLVRVCSYLNESQMKVVLTAYHFANFFHQKHKPRFSGEPYITHPVAVACILAAFFVDEEVLAAALLHDVYEDHADRVKIEDIARLFGTRVACICEGVTKLSQVSSRHRTEINKDIKLLMEQRKASGSPDSPESELSEKELVAIEKRYIKAATLLTLIVTASQDLRTMMVKMGDRLHNMRTLRHHKNPDSKKRIAQETQDIFAPIAARLGVYVIKREFEDLAFEALDPEAYEQTEKSRMELVRERSGSIKATMAVLKDIFRDNGIDAEIEYFESNVYRIYEQWKSGQGDRDNESVVDHIRIVTEDDRACYDALRVVHKNFAQVANTLRDFLGTAKSNGYRALHTSIYGSEQRIIAVHICPKHQVVINDNGFFAPYATTKYTCADEIGKSLSQFYGQDDNGECGAGSLKAWFQTLADEIKNSNSTIDFVNKLKDEQLCRDITAFTPNRDRIDLPPGSTPIDFAYALHTRLGDSACGCLINGRKVDLMNYHIVSNDIVSIQTSKTAAPKHEWYYACKTDLARRSIKAWFGKSINRESNVKAGKIVASEVLKSIGLSLLIYDTDFMNEVAKSLQKSDADDLYAALGCWQVSKEILTRHIILEYRQGLFTKRKESALLDGSAKAENLIQAVSGIPKGYRMVLMKCCMAIPGDKIIGYLANNGEARVHRDGCQVAQNMKKNDSNLFVDLDWRQGIGNTVKSKSMFYVECEVSEHLLGNIISCFDDNEEHIYEYHYCEADNGKTAQLRIYFMASSREEITAFKDKLLKVPEVKSVHR